jgi:hypothetical protein
MTRIIPKGAKKMKDFRSKLQAQNFESGQIELGYKTHLTSYNSMGMKEHPMYAVYYWAEKKK